jgi:hypothetical protein
VIFSFSNTNDIHFQVIKNLAKINGLKLVEGWKIHKQGWFSETINRTK